MINDSFLPRFALTLAITGHRQIPAEQTARIKSQLSLVMEQVKGAAEAISRHGHTFGIFSGVPNLCLASCLSEGADRLAANSALASGYELLAFLPFPMDSPVNALDLAENEQAQSRQDLAALCARAKSVVEFAPDYPFGWQQIRPPFSPAGDGQFAADYRQQAYLTASLAMLDNADMLVAIWSGHPQAAPGSSFDIIRQALKRGMSVVIIDSQKDVPPRIVQDLEKLFQPGEINDSIGEVINRRWGLTGNLGRRLEKEKITLARYQARKLPRLGRLWSFFEKALTRKAMHNVDPGPYREDPRADFKLFDNAANYCAANYRSSFLGIAFLSIFAVLFAAVAAVFPHNEYHRLVLIFCSSLQGVLLTWVIYSTNRAREEAWQEHLTRYRYAAEVLRCNSVMASLALPTLLDSRDGQSLYSDKPDESWLKYVLRNCIRDYGVKSVNLAGDHAHDLFKDLEKYLIYSQICYHNATHIKCSIMAAFIARVCKLLFILSLTVVGSRFTCAVIFDSEIYAPILSFFATIGPAAATSMHSIAQYADLQRLAIRSGNICTMLKKYKIEYDAATSAESKRNVIAKIISLMLKDVRDWKDQYNLTVK